MANSKAISWAAGATTLGAVTWLFLFFHPYPPDIDHRLHEAVGEVMAGEAARLLEPGGRIIVIARDTGSFEVPAAEAQLEGFLHALNKRGLGVPIVQLVKVDPLRPVAVPPGDFFDLLRQGRDTDVLVSFLGPPILGADQLAKLGDKRPRVLALCAGAMSSQIDLKRLFAQKLLSAAVVSRADAPARAVTSGGQSAFDQMFRLITPANLSELAALTAAFN